MSDNIGRPSIYSIDIEIKSPTGSIVKLRIDEDNVGGIVFDDKLIQILLGERNEPVWKDGMSIWNDEDKPAYLLLPKGEESPDGRGPSCCKTGQCIGGGNCGTTGCH